MEAFFVLILLLAAAGITVIFSFRRLAHFLSPVRPVAATVMVMEGWLPDRSIEHGCLEYLKGRYDRLFVTGGPIVKGSFLSAYKSYSELTAATAIALGIPADQVVCVPCPKTEIHRTHTSANYLLQHLTHYPISAFNLYTDSCHARRSHYIYRRVFGPKVVIGVIAAPIVGFDPNRWWTTSSGVRTVLSEAIAYGYVRLIQWRD